MLFFVFFPLYNFFYGFSILSAQQQTIFAEQQSPQFATQLDQMFIKYLEIKSEKDAAEQKAAEVMLQNNLLEGKVLDLEKKAAELEKKYCTDIGKIFLEKLAKKVEEQDEEKKELRAIKQKKIKEGLIASQEALKKYILEQKDKLLRVKDHNNMLIHLHNELKRQQPKLLLFKINHYKKRLELAKKEQQELQEQLQLLKEQLNQSAQGSLERDILSSMLEQFVAQNNNLASLKNNLENHIASMNITYAQDKKKIEQELLQQIAEKTMQADQELERLKAFYEQKMAEKDEEKNEIHNYLSDILNEYNEKIDVANTQSGTIANALNKAKKECLKLSSEKEDLQDFLELLKKEHEDEKCFIIQITDEKIADILQQRDNVALALQRKIQDSINASLEQDLVAHLFDRTCQEKEAISQAKELLHIQIIDLQKAFDDERINIVENSKSEISKILLQRNNLLAALKNNLEMLKQSGMEQQLLANLVSKANEEKQALEKAKQQVEAEFQIIIENKQQEKEKLLQQKDDEIKIVIQKHYDLCFDKKNLEEAFKNQLNMHSLASLEKTLLENLIDQSASVTTNQQKIIDNLKEEVLSKNELVQSYQNRFLKNHSRAKKLRNKVANLKAIILSNQNDIQKAEQKYQEQVNKFASIMTEHQDKKVDLEKNLEKSFAQAESFKTREQTLQQLLSELTSFAKDKEQDINLIKNGLGEEKKKKAELMKNMQAKFQELFAKKKEKYKSKKEDLLKRLQILAQSNLAKNGDISKLENELSSLSTLKSELQRDLQIYLDELSIATDSLRQLHETNYTLQKNHDNYKQQAVILSDKVEILEKELEKSVEAKEQLFRENAGLKEDLSRKNGLLKKLSSSLSQAKKQIETLSVQKLMLLSESDLHDKLETSLIAFNNKLLAENYAKDSKIKSMQGVFCASNQFVLKTALATGQLLGKINIKKHSISSDLKNICRLQECEQLDKISLKSICDGHNLAPRKTFSLESNFDTLLPFSDSITHILKNKHFAQNATAQEFFEMQERQKEEHSNMLRAYKIALLAEKSDKEKARAMWKKLTSAAADYFKDVSISQIPYSKAKEQNNLFATLATA